MLRSMVGGYPVFVASCRHEQASLCCRLCHQCDGCASAAQHLLLVIFTPTSCVSQSPGCLSAAAAAARLSRCVGHSSAVRHLDWSADGSCIQSMDQAYEVSSCWMRGLWICAFAVAWHVQPPVIQYCTPACVSPVISPVSLQQQPDASICV
jgi:hypothetical protein